MRRWYDVFKSQRQVRGRILVTLNQWPIAVGRRNLGGLQPSDGVPFVTFEATFPYDKPGFIEAGISISFSGLLARLPLPSVIIQILRARTLHHECKKLSVLVVCFVTVCPCIDMLNLPASFSRRMAFLAWKHSTICSAAIPGLLCEPPIVATGFLPSSGSS
ncbi:hypothetical protein V6N13_085295 [Hibiscus sabdariffa]